MRTPSFLKLAALIVVLALVAAVPQAQAIDKCHAPCLTAFEQCVAPCLRPSPPPNCSQQCSTNYNYCLAHTGCPPGVA
jgi:hypothetical protein